MTAPEIPGFTYLQHLGSGGFADVLLYEQAYPRQRVAVKVVRSDMVLDEREKRLFTSEADAMARLADHPYIVSVITAGETVDGRPYLIMRYCPPPDLGARVRASPMSVADALSTGIKLASAIETAHRAGVLHRDVKPSNVLVTTYSEPALTDFGIAALMHEVDADDDVRISYPWAPPELLDGRSNGSVASDVYSLGATIWNLLVGRSPFVVPHGDNSSHALSARILHSPAPSTQRPDVPPALDRLLQQCLAKQPEHRPRSALDLARGLQRIEAAAGLSRTSMAVEISATAPAPDAGTRPDSDPDVTHVKPLGVVPASGPPTGEAEAPGSNRPTPRGAVLWGLAGAATLALVGVLVLSQQDGGSDRGPTVPIGPSTPSDVLVGAPPPAPLVTARRIAAGARFEWRAIDRTTPGDSWQWRDVDTGQGERSDQTSLVRRGTGRLCIEVRLVRTSGSSAWTKKCQG